MKDQFKKVHSGKTPIFLSYCKQKYNNKKYLLILCCFHSKDYPRRPTWTLDFAPAFSPRFSFPLSPRSLFHTRQRFPLPNHVTSGCLSPRSLFTTGQRFPLPNHVTSGCLSPRSLFTPWSAVSPHHVTSDVTRPIRSQDWEPYEPPLLLVYIKIARNLGSNF